MFNNITDGLKQLFGNKITSYYEAVQDSRLRKRSSFIDYSNADTSHASGGWELVYLARELEQNYDIASGALDLLVSRIVGRELMVEPVIIGRDGRLLKELNQKIEHYWQMWFKNLDITDSLKGGRSQRVDSRSVCRDGETFKIIYTGDNVPHPNNAVPLSLGFFETEYVPYWLNKELDNGNRIIEGVEKNRWGQPVAYWMCQEHPGNPVAILNQDDLIRVPASQVVHSKSVKRLGQTRGVTLFHPVFTRFSDVRNYDESERVAARMASAIGLQILTDKDVRVSTTTQTQKFQFKPGMIFDKLAPGQKVEVVSSDRPNSNLEAFRKGQLRMGAAGLGISYSSLARDYDGSYSSERQAMIESHLILQGLISDYTADWEIIYKVFLDNLLTTDRFFKDIKKIKKFIDFNTFYQVSIRSPAVPWIDPLREAKANQTMLNLKLDSRSGLIRRYGRNPETVDSEIANDQERERKLGIGTSTVNKLGDKNEEA